MNSTEYKEYLASRKWAVLRERVRERSRNTCERCGINSQQAVHHLTYERVGRELLEDLQAICTPCHEFLSGKRDDDPALLGSRDGGELSYRDELFMWKSWYRNGQISKEERDDAIKLLKDYLYVKKGIVIED